MLRKEPSSAPLSRNPNLFENVNPPTTSVTH
jgi:hypothetical protein